MWKRMVFFYIVFIRLVVVSDQLKKFLFRPEILKIAVSTLRYSTTQIYKPGRNKGCECIIIFLLRLLFQGYTLSWIV